MLEAAAPYARWIDVFCEPHSAHAFTEDEARAVLLAGRAAGRGLRVHGADLQAMLTLPAVPPQLGWRIAIGPRGRRPRHARATGGRRATSPVGQSRRHPHAADQQVHRPAREGRLAVVRLRFAVRGWNASAPAPCGTPQRHWTTSLRATRACRVALVGHSMGGRVALMLARDPRPATRDPRSATRGSGPSSAWRRGSSERTTSPCRRANSCSSCTACPTGSPTRGPAASWWSRCARGHIASFVGLARDMHAMVLRYRVGTS